MKNEYTFQSMFHCEASSLDFESASQAAEQFETQMKGLNVQSVGEINHVVPARYFIKGTYTVTVKAPNMPSGWVAAAEVWKSEDFTNMMHPYRGDFALLSVKELNQESKEIR